MQFLAADPMDRIHTMIREGEARMVLRLRKVTAARINFKDGMLCGYPVEVVDNTEPEGLFQV